MAVGDGQHRHHSLGSHGVGHAVEQVVGQHIAPCRGVLDHTCQLVGATRRKVVGRHRLALRDVLDDVDALHHVGVLCRSTLFGIEGAQALDVSVGR